MKKLVEMRGITKIFPGVTANDRVDFDLDEGEIHALLGENGSGKSTLMNILAGFYRPDTGEIRIKGKKVNLRSPGDALSLGIGMVYQHFRLVENFTVAENIILGMSKGGIWLNYRRLHEKIAQLAATMGLPVNPAARIWQLSVGERQRVEILKVLWREAQIIILDEPTAVLTPQEAGELFAGLKRLKESGCVIVLISHKLQEALTVADRVTVLRRGKKVATLPNQGLNAKALSLLMIGREVAFQAGKQTLPGTEAVINLAQVSATGDSGIPALKKVSLVVHAGEILGIAGIAGNGQKELAEAASGLRRVSSGKILIGGQDLTQKGV
ncbi:MAG TPA: heme ABC transporter ATP-binding protein, partial [Desulfobacterales bacterium]|nr:heme ABC transporter ATP-binding protein [Desulfobacterales bacterium]